MYKLQRSYLLAWIHGHKSELSFDFVIEELQNHIELIILNGCGITVHIRDNGQATVTANYQNKHWDILADFDLSIKKDQKGFFCYQCDKGMFYKDIEKLVEEHTLIPLWSWLSDNLKSQNHLCFYQFEDDVTWSKIIGPFGIKYEPEKKYLISSQVFEF